MCCFDTLITWSEVGMMSDITAGTPRAAYSREKLPERGKRGADGRQRDFQPTRRVGINAKLQTPKDHSSCAPSGRGIDTPRMSARARSLAILCERKLFVCALGGLMG